MWLAQKERQGEGWVGQGTRGRTKPKDKDTMGYPFFLCTLFFRIEHDTEVDYDELKKECQVVRLIPRFR